MKTFYVYTISSLNIPIYIGKGTKTLLKNDRIKLSRTLNGHLDECEKLCSLNKGTLKSNTFVKHKYDLSFEIIYETETETLAFDKECELIQFYGRKDLSLGPLVNLTDGGEGARGFIPPKALRDKWSKMRQGPGNGMHGKHHSKELKLTSSIRRSETNSKRRWFNNGIISSFLIECPVNWSLGRLNQKPTTSGNKWYNNGIVHISTKIKPDGDNWLPGMLPKLKL